MLFITIKENNCTKINYKYDNKDINKCKIYGVLFDINSELTLNKEYIFIGKISIYNKELELIVNEIKNINT